MINLQNIYQIINHSKLSQEVNNLITKNLKLLSNDNEYDIQYKLDAKYPKPKVYP